MAGKNGWEYNDVSEGYLFESENYIAAAFGEGFSITNLGNAMRCNLAFNPESRKVEITGNYFSDLENWLEELREVSGLPPESKQNLGMMIEALSDERVENVSY